MKTTMKEIYEMNIFYEAFIIIAQNIKILYECGLSI